MEKDLTEKKIEILTTMLTVMDYDKLNTFMHKCGYWGRNTFIANNLHPVFDAIMGIGQVDTSFNIKSDDEYFLFDYLQGKGQIIISGIREDYNHYKNTLHLDEIAENILTDGIASSCNYMDTLIDLYKEDEAYEDSYSILGEEMDGIKMVELLKEERPYTFSVNIVVKAESVAEAEDQIAYILNTAKIEEGIVDYEITD